MFPLNNSVVVFSLPVVLTGFGAGKRVELSILLSDVKNALQTWNARHGYWWESSSWLRAPKSEMKASP
jgi:hypothetical protein